MRQPSQNGTWEAPPECEKLFAMKVTEHWDRLSGEAGESPSMEMFKIHLHAFLCDYCREPDIAEGWT